MEPEIIAALLTVGGVLITALITYYQFRKEQWQKSVSDSRNHWLNCFRDEFGVLAGYIEFLQSYECQEELEIITEVFPKENEVTIGYNTPINKEEKCSKKLLEALNAKNKLYTRINTNSSTLGNEYNEAYKLLLESIDFSKITEFDLDLFKKLTNLILEKEWQKVKRETKGDI